MTVAAFEGPAGSGKTHRLMEELAGELQEHPLASHQRVLALTFMNGARRRLDARLRELESVERRFDAATLDSLAWRIAQRWQSLALSLGHALPAEEQYNETCALAAILLERPIVASWVSISSPVVLIDEAQDLNAERSRMIAALARTCRVLLAFDEFQCLNPNLLPIAVKGWLREYCEPVPLTGCHRTDSDELIAAAHAVREGQAVKRDGKCFKVRSTPGKPNNAATWVANAIAWRKGGDVAVLTPSRGFANDVVGLVRAKPLGNQHNGPYPIQWESSDEKERAALWATLAVPDTCSVKDALIALEPHRDIPEAKSARDWIRRQENVLGIREITSAQILRRFNHAFSVRRKYGGRRQPEMLAMTIHQAKNREFDHVIVIWPYNVPDDNEQKRRLLYNAVTRAKRSCLILVQGDALLQGPPFTP